VVPDAQAHDPLQPLVTDPPSCLLSPCVCTVQDSSGLNNRIFAGFHGYFLVYRWGARTCLLLWQRPFPCTRRGQKLCKVVDCPPPLCHSRPFQFH
jgi:hypothetical protein